MDLLKMSFSGTTLILIIIIIRVLLLHKLPKKTFSVLWGIAVFRLLIPFSIPSRFSFYTIADILKNNLSKSDFFLEKTTTFYDNMTVLETTSIAPEVATQGISPLLVIWLGGLSVCTLFFVVTHLRCRKEYKTALPIDNKFVKLWQQKHPTIRNVHILQSDRITTPLTYGIFNPVVLMPKITDWIDTTQLDYILTHEFIHIRHFDMLTKILLATALSIHWFNPFVWIMYLLANLDIELSCDETVVKTFGENMKSAYALTLIGLEEKKSSLTPLMNNFSKNSTEKRIVAIMKIKKTSKINIILAIVLIFGTVTLFSTSASSSILPNNTETSTDKETILQYKTPGKPDNHSGYTEKEYEILMSLKTDSYRQLKTQDFLYILKQNNIDMIYSGYNPNDKNVDFLKSVHYSLSEYFAQLEEEENGVSTTPSISISTASNKLNTNGEYYGAELSFTVFWLITDRLTVGERDDILNTTLEEIQNILEQKTQSQIGDSKNLKIDFDTLAKHMSTTKIKISIQIDKYVSHS